MLLRLRWRPMRGTLSSMDEHWLERAIEDKLGQVIDKYRAQGKDVHNVASLRKRVAADLNALRGTPEWANLRNRYEPPLQNRVGWCRVCEKPINMGSVSAWIEDKVGHVYCSHQCKDDAKHVFITLNEWKRRVKEKGSVTGRRKEVKDGQMVEGEEFTLLWEDVKDWNGKYQEPEMPAAAVADEIDWD